MNPCCVTAKSQGLVVVDEVTSPHDSCTKRLAGLVHYPKIKR